MAEIAGAEIPIYADDPVPIKKGRNSRKPLKQKNQSTTEANILAQTLSQTAKSLAMELAPCPGDENHGSLLQTKKSKGAAKSKQNKQQSSFEKDLQEMQEKLQQLKIEKEKCDDLLKAKDEMLKLKEVELENKGKEQEKLQVELKKLQKWKDFKPTLALPIFQSMKEKEQDKKEKKKKKKGGNEKKRPAPPYVLWLKDQWNEVKKENPEAAFKETSHILGAKWKQVSAEEKRPYEEKYQAEKEAYLQVVTKEKRETEAMKLLEEEQKQKTAMELLEQYLQFKQEVEQGEKKKSKKERDPLKPKIPPSAYLVYSNERRAALVADGKKFLEVAKITGEEWNKMTEEEKRPYEEVVKKNKEKYMQEMELYRQTKDEEELNLKKEEDELTKLQKQEAMQLLKKKEKTEKLIKKNKEKQQKNKGEKKIVDPNKPKKPASSFILFSKEARKSIGEERHGINNSTMNAMISVKWKELSEEEKQVWNNKAAEAMQAYKKELEEYNSENPAN